MDNFYLNVIRSDRRLHSPTRISDLALLEPVTRRKVTAIIADLSASGRCAICFETFRSVERQLSLYRQGVSRLKTIGVHHFGLAADLVFLDASGAPTWDVDYSLLGHVARSHGMIWGGDWGDPNRDHAFIDPDHVQRIAVDRQPALFKGEWYPSEQSQ